VPNHVVESVSHAARPRYRASGHRTCGIPPIWRKRAILSTSLRRSWRYGSQLPSNGSTRSIRVSHVVESGAATSRLTHNCKMRLAVRHAASSSRQPISSSMGCLDNAGWVLQPDETLVQSCFVTSLRPKTCRPSRLWHGDTIIADHRCGLGLKRAFGCPILGLFAELHGVIPIRNFHSANSSY
jgi:hypothetical protein